MSQANYSIGANQSGTAYRTADNNGKAAIASSHKGSSAPSYAIAGMFWIDDSGGTTWTYKMYDGTDWITIGTFDTSTNIFTPANTADQFLVRAYAAASGTNTITATYSPAPSAYVTGQVYFLKIANENTGAVTVNYNSLGAKNLYKDVNVSLAKGDLLANSLQAMVYDGTNMQLLSFPQSAKATHNVRLVTGTSDTLVYSDRGKLVTYTNSSSIATAIAQAGTAGFEAGWMTWLQNRGVGAMTVTPTTSTIDGASTLVLNQNEGVVLFSDGTNYYTSRGKPNISTVGWPKGYLDVAKPVWASATTITVNYIRVRDNTDAYNLEKTTQLILDATTTGVANGMQSITANTWFYLYVIGKTDGTVALFASATNEFISGTISLPSGYTLKRQLRTAFKLDGSNNIRPFLIGDGWPYAAVHHWDHESSHAIQAGAFTTGTSQVLNAGAATTFTDVNCSAWAPPNSRRVGLWARTTGTTSSAFKFRPNGATHEGKSLVGPSDNTIGDFSVGLDSSQIFEYKRVAGSGGNVYVDVMSWVWDQEF